MSTTQSTTTATTATTEVTTTLSSETPPDSAPGCYIVLCAINYANRTGGTFVRQNRMRVTECLMIGKCRKNMSK